MFKRKLKDHFIGVTCSNSQRVVFRADDVSRLTLSQDELAITLRNGAISTIAMGSFDEGQECLQWIKDTCNKLLSKK